MRLPAKSDVLYALGYTPYDAANPAGYIDAAYLAANLSPLAAPKASPTFSGAFQSLGTSSFLGTVLVQSGLVNINSPAAQLILGAGGGTVSTPRVLFRANGAAGRNHDAQIAVTGGSATQDGRGIVDVTCSAFTINGQSIPIAGTGTPGSVLPLANAVTALVGASGSFAREDHVHPHPTNPTFRNLNLDNGASAAGIELGSKSSAQTPFIDLNSSGGGNDYDVRLIANGGTAGTSGAGGLTVYAAGTTFIGSVTANFLMVGSNTASLPELRVNGSAGTLRYASFMTGGLTRWRLRVDDAAESGGAAGSDFGLWRYDDSGAVLGGAPSLAINRASGAIALNGRTSIAGTAASQSGGVLTVSNALASSTADLVVSNTATPNGAGIKITGSGATTPNKHIRVASGRFQIVDSAYVNTILTLQDAGRLQVGVNVPDDGTSMLQVAASTGAAVALTDAGNAVTAQATISATSNAQGAAIRLTGNGATTPSKTIRVRNGALEVANSAFNSVPLTLTDDGSLTLTGAATATNLTLTSDASQTALSGAWTAWTPTLTPQTGSGQNVINIFARYKKIGRTVYWQASFAINAAGSASGFASFQLPFGSQIPCGFAGMDISFLRGIIGTAYGSPANVTLCRYDGTTPWVTGAQLVLGGVYEATT